MTVSLIVPNTIATTDFISSTIPENDYSAWSAATNYALAARCISTTTHRIYESLAAGNLNHDPTDINNRTGETPWWLDVGATNKWALFDGLSSSQSSALDTFTIVVQPSYYDSIYLGGLAYGSIHLTMQDYIDGPVIYDSNVIYMDASVIDDYWEYFFSPYLPMTDYLFTEITYGNIVTIEFRADAGSNAVCGILAFGTRQDLGQCLYGARSKPKTYSYINVDDFGVNQIVRRKSATDISLTAIVDIIKASDSIKAVQSALDIPAVWIGSELLYYEGLRIFGLGSGELSYDNPENCTLTLNVLGLI